MKREPLIVKVPTTLMLLTLGKWAALTKPQQRFLEHAGDCTPPSPRAVRFEWSLATSNTSPTGAWRTTTTAMPSIRSTRSPIRAASFYAQRCLARALPPTTKTRRTAECTPSRSS